MGILEDAKGQPSTRWLAPVRKNFSNALAMLAINLEEMILAQTAAMADTVGRMAIDPRGQGTVAAGTVVPAPLTKTRRKVEPQATTNRLTRKQSGPARGSAAPKQSCDLKEMTPNR